MDPTTVPHGTILGTADGLSTDSIGDGRLIRATPSDGTALGSHDERRYSQHFTGMYSLIASCHDMRCRRGGTPACTSSLPLDAPHQATR